LYWGKIGWFHVAAAAFYVTNMETTTPWILAHLWSVSIEEQFYLLWPFAHKKWHRDKTAILIGVFSLTPFFSAGLYAFKIHNGMASSLPVYADKLAIGCLLAIFAPRLPRIGKPLAVLMLFAALLIPWFPSISAARSLFMLFVLRPLLDLCLAGLLLHVIQIPYRFLNWAPVAWLGKISYSLYLWQQLFCFSPSLHLGYLLIVPAIACACLSYYCIEQPMLRVRERFQRNHGQPEPPVPSSTPAANPELAASIP
jgi:peptidoglycan/LPS O-acetylase OafA/YrhL